MARSEFDEAYHNFAPVKTMRPRSSRGVEPSAVSKLALQKVRRRFMRGIAAPKRLRQVGRFMSTLAQHRRTPGLPALLAALSAVGPLSVDTYLPSITEIGRVMQATPEEVQQTLTSYMITFAAMTLWHGAISDAVGRRRVILWSIALYLISTLACVFAPSLGLLILFRALQGMTAGAGMVVGRAVIRDLFYGAEAQRLMSHVTLVFAIAPAVAPILGGWLQVAFGWRSVFIFLLLFGCVAWALCQKRLPETLPLEKRQPLHPGFLARSYFNVLRSPSFVAVCCGMTLNFAGIFIYIVSAPTFITKHLGLTETAFVWLFGPVTAGMAGGSWLSSRLAGRVSTQRTLAIGYVLMGISSAANLAISHVMRPALPWSVLPLLTYSLGMSLIFPTLTIMALDLFPAQRGLAASCQSFVQTAGAAILSIAVTLIWGSVQTLANSQTLLLLAGLAATGLHLFLRRGSGTAAVELPPAVSPISPD